MSKMADEKVQSDATMLFLLLLLFSSLFLFLLLSLYLLLLVFTASSFAPLFVSFHESEAFKSSFSV